MSNRTRLGLLIGLFLILEAGLVSFVDQPVSQYLRDLNHDHKSFIGFFRAYTDFGKSKWYLWPSLVLMLLGVAAQKINKISLVWRSRIEHLALQAFFVFCAVASSGIVTDILKPIIGRARPVMLERDGFHGFKPLSFDATFNSMPSGHATTAFAMTTCLSLLFPRYRYVWMIVGISLGLSRIMVNAHFVSDVLAGAFIGTATTVLICKQFQCNKKYPMLKIIFPIDRDISVI